MFDCGPEGEDEPILKSLLINKTYSPCAQPHMVPCMEEHPKCYYLREICTYKLDIHYHIIPCRNGGHLEYCKNFECNLMFKCSDSYCIPWPYVCDGKMMNLLIQYVMEKRFVFKCTNARIPYRSAFMWGMYVMGLRIVLLVMISISVS